METKQKYIRAKEALFAIGVGEMMTLRSLTEAVDAVVALIPDSEGWDYTSCPGDYAPEDVIMSLDESQGYENENDRGDNLFEVYFEEPVHGERNPDSVVTVNEIIFNL